jgi:double-stranded uracil-DNA glycosylase
MSVLPDVLEPGLQVVYVGMAASKKSAERSAYYAGPGNAFWRILHEAGFTPRQFAPEEYRTLLRYGMGLTNMAPGAIGNDDVLTPEDFDPVGVRAKIAQYAPHVLAFVGKRAAKVFLGRAQVPYGHLPDTVGNTVLWVLPSTSGAARRYWDPARWHALAAWLRESRPSEGQDGVV